MRDWIRHYWISMLRLHYYPWSPNPTLARSASLLTYGLEVNKSFHATVCFHASLASWYVGGEDGEVKGVAACVASQDLFSHYWASRLNIPLGGS